MSARTEPHGAAPLENAQIKISNDTFRMKNSRHLFILWE